VHVGDVIKCDVELADRTGASALWFAPEVAAIRVRPTEIAAVMCQDIADSSVPRHR